MERYTRRSRNGEAFIFGNQKDAVNKLADIEDAEEQGWLIIDVVRCGECEFAKPWPSDHRGIECHNMCWEGRYTNVCLGKDSYCSQGKRKREMAVSANA